MRGARVVTCLVSRSSSAFLSAASARRTMAAISRDDTGGGQVRSSSSKTEILSHHQYKTTGMDVEQMNPSAFAQFRSWFDEATKNAEVIEPEAMNLSTVALVRTKDGQEVARPSARFVLLKQVDERGFVFFSNYESRKGQELERNPFAALTFYWHALHRSVRVCGRVERLTRADNDRYFNQRPLGSRMGAIASPQSQSIADRQLLEERVRAVEREHGVPGAAGLTPEEQEKQHEDKHVDVPAYWGGYRVVPDEVEFWMGRTNRLHDRFRYTRDPSSDKDEWQIDRLAP